MVPRVYEEGSKTEKEREREKNGSHILLLHAPRDTGTNSPLVTGSQLPAFFSIPSARRKARRCERTRLEAGRWADSVGRLGRGTFEGRGKITRAVPRAESVPR